MIHRLEMVTASARDGLIVLLYAVDKQDGSLHAQKIGHVSLSKFGPATTATVCALVGEWVAGKLYDDFGDRGE